MPIWGLWSEKWQEWWCGRAWGVMVWHTHQKAVAIAQKERLEYLEREDPDWIDPGDWQIKRMDVED